MTAPRPEDKPDTAVALREAIDFLIRKPNTEFAYSRCMACQTAFWQREEHRSDCPLPKWKAALSAVPELQQRTINAGGSGVRGSGDEVKDSLPAPAAPTEGPPARAEDQDFSIFAEALALTEQAVSPAEGPTPVGDAFNFWWAGIEERDDWSESVRQLAWSAWKASAARDGAVSASGKPCAWMNDKGFVSVQRGGGYETPLYAAPVSTSGALDAAMDNVLAWRLGEIAKEAGAVRQDVGDPIDRGLILLRLLNERGFALSASGTITKENP